MKILEVRCCCDPTKVLGHLAHPRLQALGDRWKFKWTRLADSTFEPLGFQLGQVVFCEVELTVDRVTVGQRTFEAIKSHDYPLEDLGYIPGFTVHLKEAADGNQG